MTIRGGGNPHTAMAAMPLGEWTRRLGALLAEAYDCFMVGTLDGSTEYKRGSRAIARGQWQAPPRIIAWQTTRSRAVCRRARVGQGQAFGGAEEAPSLTLAARDGDGQYAVGAEECSRRGSNKRINKQGRDKMVCTNIDKESVPELGSHGSVRGARGNSRPYREQRLHEIRRHSLRQDRHR